MMFCVDVVYHRDISLVLFRFEWEVSGYNAAHYLSVSPSVQNHCVASKDFYFLYNVYDAEE